MKDDFSYVIENKGFIRETLTNVMDKKSAYTIINVYTTGLGDEDMPTRVYGEHYTYNEENKRYETAFVFNEVVAGNDETKKSLLDNTSIKPYKKTILEAAGISGEDYLNDKNVISVNDFKNKFDYFLNAVNSGTVIINNESFAIKYLAKIGCDKELVKMKNDLRLVDQSRLIKELYPSTSKPTLEEIAKVDYGKDIKDYTDKVEVLGKILVAYGLNKNLLNKNSDYITMQNEVTQSLVEKGKIKYKNDTANGKFDYMIKPYKKTPILKTKTTYKSGSFDFPPIYTPQTDKLDEAIKNRKAFVFMQCSTTGFSHGNLPLSVTLIEAVYNKDTNRYELARLNRENSPSYKYCKDILIKADNESVLAAHEDALDGKYDVFKEGNIDFDRYIKGLGRKKDEVVYSQDKAVEIIIDFFKNLPDKDYVIVSNGSNNVNPSISYSGACLKSLANLPQFNMDFIDGTQFLKEYAYEKYNGFKDYGNEIIDFKTWNEDNFALENFAHHYNSEYSNLYGSLNKMSFTMRLINIYANEALEKERTSKEMEVQNDLTEVLANSSNTYKTSEDKPYEEDNYEDYEDFEDYLDDEPPYYDNEDYLEDELDEGVFEEEQVFHGKQPAEVFMESDNREHGRLYSDKVNDSVPIVRADNVEKIGDASVPHVSEARFSMPEHNEILAKITAQNELLISSMAIQNQTLATMMDVMSQTVELLTNLTKDKDKNTPIKESGESHEDNLERLSDIKTACSDLTEYYFNNKKIKGNLTKVGEWTDKAQGEIRAQYIEKNDKQVESTEV